LISFPRLFEVLLKYRHHHHRSIQFVIVDRISVNAIDRWWLLLTTISDLSGNIAAADRRHMHWILSAQIAIAMTKDYHYHCN
jgi:hypothetical protein